MAMDITSKLGPDALTYFSDPSYIRRILILKDVQLFGHPLGFSILDHSSQQSLDVVLCLCQYALQFVEFVDGEVGGVLVIFPQVDVDLVGIQSQGFYTMENLHRMTNSK